MIPYGRQEVTEEDISAVIEVLKSDRLTQGEAVTDFEQAVAQYCGVEYAVACNSGTSALHLACLALGIGSGDLVWTSPITFLASANCAKYCGADVDFIDICPQTFCIDTQILTSKFKESDAKGKLPKALIVVHFAGLSANMEVISQLCRQYNVAIIEDAAHALGGKYCGQPVGCCKYSDISIFSFHPVKMITTGEGGMAVTQSELLATRMRELCSHGVVRGDAWEYEQRVLGFNYRLTDIQAVLGLSQLQRLDNYVEQRRQLAVHYQACLGDDGLVWQHEPDLIVNTYHLFVVQLPESTDRRAFYNFMHQRGVGVQVHYIPVHTQPYYQQQGFAWGDFPNAETFYQRALSLPLFPTMTDQQQEVVINAVRDGMSLLCA